jgi:ferredoxin-NADP reductase
MGLLVPTTAEYVGRYDEAGEVTAFRFKPAKPLKHTAGQHGLFFLKGAGMRAFSIASAPEDDEVLIATKLGSGSRFKKALGALAPGDRVKVRGPILKFTLAGARHEIVFVAQGIGITPFRSLLRHMQITGLRKHSTLIHVGDGHPFRADTEPLARRAYYPTDTESFRVDLKETYTDRPGATYYVSGSPAFIKETVAVLLDGGISAKQIKKDMFRGY